MELRLDWGRRRSGGLTGLQNQLAWLNPGLVGSIPTRSRHRLSRPSSNDLGDPAWLTVALLVDWLVGRLQSR